MDEEGRLRAIAVVELGHRKNERGRLTLWFLERLAEQFHDDASTEVTGIVDDITERSGGKTPTVYANVTGAGRPVLGVLRFHQPEPRIIPVYLKDGDERSEQNGAVMLGKGRLVFQLQELRLRGEFDVRDPARAGAEELKQELRDYRPRDEPGPLMIALSLAMQKRSGRMWVGTW